MGFGEAFLRLSESSDPDSTGVFLLNFAHAFVYSFRMGLGDNNTDPFDEITQPVTAWILFILCSLFTGIVMLNILISVIGQSFERINSQSVVSTYKERADLISENGNLVRRPFIFFEGIPFVRRNTSSKCRLVLTDVTNEEIA